VESDDAFHRDQPPSCLADSDSTTQTNNCIPSGVGGVLATQPCARLCCSERNCWPFDLERAARVFVGWVPTPSTCQAVVDAVRQRRQHRRIWQADQLDTALIFPGASNRPSLSRRVVPAHHGLQAALGQPDAIQRTYGQLVACLDDFDEEPADATRQLFTGLRMSSGHRS